MKSKKRSISIVTAVALIVIAIALTISITMGLAISYFNKTFGNVNQKRVLLEYISKTDEFINNNYYGDVSEDSLRTAIVKGYLNGINDPHASFISGEDYLKLEETMTGKVTDFGIELAQTLDGESMVVYVHEGSPAGRAGLAVGDVVVMVNDENVRQKTTDDITNTLKKTNKAKITITHGMGDEELTVEITKTQFTYQSVRYSVLDQFTSDDNANKKQKIGYIRITDFYANTTEQFEVAYKSLISENVTDLIFDLRFNRGGNIDSVNGILKAILPKQQYAFIKKKGELIKLSGEGTSLLNKPSIVLINNNTSTESELFAAVMRESGGAKIVGQTSKGVADLVGYFVVGNDHSAIRFTIGELATAKGANWKSVGISPDKEVFNDIGTFVGIVPLTIDEDFQLLGAVEEITKDSEDDKNPTGETTSTSASETTVKAESSAAK